jgi:putative tricarboxylic transport membrane protein
MIGHAKSRSTSFLVILMLAASACGLQTDGGSEDSGGSAVPANTEYLVHTGPGGGSDIFARELIALMREEGIISKNWPVRNEDAGEGAGAMAYLMSKEGESTNISGITTTWLTTPLTIEGAGDITIEDFTPIAGLIIEPEVMAVANDSPYQSLKDFVEAAKKQPGSLVQTGGSTTEVGALNGESIQAAAGTDWNFLSFEEVGQRVAALLSGDADMMFGSAQDFAAQIKAGKIEVVATISPNPSPLFPDAPTVEEEGFGNITLVPQVRGVVGPPNMPQEAIDYYQGVFEETVATDAWKKYAEKNGLVTQLRLGEEWGDFLAEQNEIVKKALETADL